MNNLGVFDATTVQPNQGSSKHPVGMFPFTITNTDIGSTNDGKNGLFKVELTSPAGVIVNNYNLWHSNTQTVEIARKELSALCHAVGIFKVNMDNKGRELVGGKGTMKVNWQKGHEPSAEKPEGGYVEVEKVFDSNGNEPGKASTQASPQAQSFQQSPPNNAAPMQAQPGGGWGAPAAPQQQAPQPQQVQPQPQGWAPQGGGGQTPAAPWGQR